VEVTEALPRLVATGARVVCLSFEALGEGSDKDRSFEKGGFWAGELFTLDSSVYKALFGRKGLFSGFFGLADISRTKLASCMEKNISGNMQGDGMALGGVFVVCSPTGEPPRVLLDHRQQFFGDDPDAEELLEAIASAPPVSPPQPVAGGGSGGGGAREVKEWGK